MKMLSTQSLRLLGLRRIKICTFTESSMKNNNDKVIRICKFLPISYKSDQATNKKNQYLVKNPKK